MFRAIFYAEPRDPNQPPKSIADSESVSAAWVTLEQLRLLRQRGPELEEWGEYLMGGGEVFPLTTVGRENQYPVNLASELEKALIKLPSIESLESILNRDILLINKPLNRKKWTALHYAAVCIGVCLISFCEL